MVTLPTPTAEQRGMFQAPAPRAQPDALTLGHWLVCSVEIYEWTLQAPAQTAQQFDLTRSTAKGFSAWQLS